MPPQTINDETLSNSIVNDDSLLYWDKSAGVQRRVERSALVGGTITGGGVVATGGYTLTVPATGTAALTSSGTFTGGGSVATGGFTLTVPATGTAALRDVANTFTQNTTFNGTITNAGSIINILDSDNGNGFPPYLFVGRNSSGTPANRRGGTIRLRAADGIVWNIWPESGGVLRIHNALPSEGSSPPVEDDDGTIVGTQQSHESYKTITGDATPIGEVLTRLQAAAAHVAQFVYTNAYHPEQYEGLILKQDAPETHHYGTDKSRPAYSAGKSLNLINLCADLMRAVVNLNERVTALEAQQGGE